MSWRLVARREVLDAGRSRGVRAIVVLFAAVAALAVVLPAAAVEGYSPPMRRSRSSWRPSRPS